MHLLIVDTMGIQPYIFGSNHLRENIGASYLVAQATEDWPFQVIDSLKLSHNINPNDNLQIDNQSDNLEVETIYACGGNFLALFRNDEDVKKFTSGLSRKVLIDAPNLQLVIASTEFDWDNQALCETVKKLFKKLADQKQSRPLSAPLLGLSVSVMCQSTGLPAVEIPKEISSDLDYPASAEICAKIEVSTEADRRLHRYLHPPHGYDFPRDFDDLGGKKGEHSYIAVVHADGNGLGQRFRDIGKEYETKECNREYITSLRAFSRATNEAAIAALKSTLALILAKAKDNKITHPDLSDLSVFFSPDKKSDKKFLPFRPIVFGGDDVTFVCDGRLGISLAIDYLWQFERETERRPGCRGKITACAGISIVKSHYPFARAYTLADELCQSAKKYRKEVLRSDADISALDWHFATGGLSGDIGEIRNREFKSKTGKDLTVRPVILGANPIATDKDKSWEVVGKGLTDFQRGDWAKKRNKLKALRDSLRGDEAEVEHFLKIFNLEELPDLGIGSDHNLKGWYGKRCPYFDAIEIMDWFIPLERSNADDAGTSFDTKE